MTPEGSRKKRRMSRPREKDEENEGARRASNKDGEEWDMQEEEVLGNEGFPSRDDLA